MADCESYLRDVIKSIEPTHTQQQGAKRSHAYLRDVLCTGKMASRIKDSYLSGSYARDTAIAPIDDVDIVFVVDHTKWQSGPTSLFDIMPSPDAILDSFARAIRYRYPESSVYSQRRSVRLSLYHLDIDVVPAIETSTSLQVRIPDSESDEWILSAPLKHAENATRVNRFQAGQFKPLVKLLKYWNGNLPNTAHVKSFMLETMAVRVFERVRYESLQDGLLMFFDFVGYLAGEDTKFQWKDRAGMSFGWFGWNVPDTAGTGSNTASRVDRQRRTRFLEHAMRSRDRLSQALSAVTVETGCRRIAEALKI